MAKEIERKFLLATDTFARHLKGLNQYQYRTRKIKQGYLLNNSKHELRVRHELNGKGTLTYKGVRVGCTRLELSVTLSNVLTMWLLSKCDKVIKKHRTTLMCSGMYWEVDIFCNLPFSIAEVELPNESYYFSKPSWCGEEVTHSERYYNKNLVNEVVK